MDPAANRLRPIEAAAIAPPVPAPRQTPVALDERHTPAMPPFDMDADEKTRIGVPAYAVSAKLVTEGTYDRPPREGALRPAQALRVVVWRTADGVHIAPHGTRVEAITVEAMLVALDPSADLAAWLADR